MWRSKKKKPNLHARDLDQVLGDFEQDRFLLEWTDHILREARGKYPILADAFDTPQSADKHAEGPVLEDHLRKMLMALYALVEGRFSLSDIEEFARMRGYEGEFEELEETIKERAAFFKAFCIVHDIGKAATISFSAPLGSRGAEEGFGNGFAAAWDDFQGDDRFVARKEYEDLYAGFAAERSGLTPREIQADFFKTYQISISNHRHARVIFAPHLLEVIRSVGEDYRLPENDIDLLVELVAAHMDPLHKFWAKSDAKQYDHLVEYANRIGRDADDFLDLLQAGVFLDVVCGTVQLSAQGYWHYSDVLVNFMKSEHDWMPERRAEAERRQATRLVEQKRAVYREVGLDGDSLMDLLGMTPGPDFGKLLREVQGAVDRPEMMPDLSSESRQEVSKRIVEARKKILRFG